MDNQEYHLKLPAKRDAGHGKASRGHPSSGKLSNPFNAFMKASQLRHRVAGTRQRPSNRPAFDAAAFDTVKGCGTRRRTRARPAHSPTLPT
jgi:hypothetical protein